MPELGGTPTTGGVRCAGTVRPQVMGTPALTATLVVSSACGDGVPWAGLRVARLPRVAPGGEVDPRVMAVPHE